jgi:hypothetical protein
MIARQCIDPRRFRRNSINLLIEKAQFGLPLRHFGIVVIGRC